jgi:hypothetical protein
MNPNLRSAYLRILVAAFLSFATRGFAVGTLVPAPNRVDMVHDAARDVLYITSGSSVLRYHLGSDAFLSPIQLTGTLVGIDLSPDGNTLVVGDRTRTETNVWVHVVDLNTLQSRRAMFARAFYEGGTYTVAFGNDGAAVVSSTFEGSGWVPLRRYDPADDSVRTVSNSIEQSSMVSSSGDGSVIGIEGSNLSSGPVYRYDVERQAITDNSGTGWFNYEIAVNKDGSQFAAPTYGGTFIYDANLDSVTTLGTYAGGQPIGVAYHPSADAVFFAWATSREIRVYNSLNFAELGRFDFQYDFTHPGNAAFVHGRLRTSRDGSIIFATVGGGIRYYRHGLTIPQYNRLNITGSPGRIGAPASQGYGTNWIIRGTMLTNQVALSAETNRTRYICAGWTGLGSLPANGITNVVVFTITNHSTLTWKWNPTEYQLTASSAGQGTLNISNAWYTTNATATLIATPGSGYRFARWFGDVPGIQTNTALVLTMDRPRQVTAVFAPIGGSSTYLAGSWPTFGNGPAHTGYFPGILGEGSFVPRWQTYVGQENQVAVSENEVFVTSFWTNAPRLAALEESSGEVLWSYMFNPGSINPPTYDSHAIYLQRGNSSDTHLWSFDAGTGKLNWVAPHGAQWERYMAPTVAEGGVYIDGGTYGGLYGFNQASGAQKFFTSVGQYDTWTPMYYNHKLYSWVAGSFREHDPNNGLINWSLTIPWDWNGYTMNRTIAAADGRAFFIGNPNLYCVDLTSHQISWQINGGFAGTPAVANGILYAVSNTTVLAFSQWDGTYLGAYSADTTLISQPIVTDDTLLISSTSKTYVFDLQTFSLRQTLPVGGPLSLANAVLYIAAPDSKLYSYSSGQDVKLVVSGTPGLFGAPRAGAYGTNSLARGTALTNAVAYSVETNGARYRCAGWIGTGDVPATGATNTVTFTLNTNSTLTWSWTPTEFFLTVVSAGGGSVNVGSGWFNAAVPVTLTATPRSGYRFVRWVGDLTAGSSSNNPVTITMDQRRRVTALFASTSDLPLAGNWPTFGNGPAHTSYFPGMLGDATFSPRWTASIGGSLQQVAIGNNAVYITPLTYFGAAYVAAVHEYSGQIRWWDTMASAFSVNPPTYDSGSVYVQRGNHSSDTHLWSFNASNGATNWMAPHSAQWERYMAPTVANGGVYVNGGYYGGMYGFNQTNGAQKFFLGMAQYDGWTPTFYNGKLYSWVAGGFNEHDPGSGAINWSLSLSWDWSGYTMNRTVAAAEGRAYFIGNPNLYAVDLTTHSVAWRVEGSFSGTPAIANGMVYAVSGGNVNAYTIDGQMVGVYTTGDSSLWQPIVTDDVLIVGSGTQTYVFDLLNFSLRQTIPVGGLISLANNVLYVATSSGVLYAYSAGPDYQLVVRSSSGLFGNPTPFSYGTNFVSAGASIAPSVSSPTPAANGTRYVATGWTGTGAVPASGASNVTQFILNQNSTLTWNWKTQYQMTIGITGNGQVNVANGTWFDAAASVTLTATPSNYFHFGGWSYDMSTGLTPFTFSLTSPTTLVANFLPDLVTNNVPKWWLAQYGLSADNAGALADTDNDGLPNWREFTLGTNPLQADTDNDGYNDGLEVVWASNPLNISSIPQAQIVVLGAPLPYGSATPLPYGTNYVPLFSAVVDSVPATIPATNGMRYLASGFSGSGSAPASGATNGVNFIANTNSVLTWNWQRQFFLSSAVISNGTLIVVREITNGANVQLQTSPDNWWADGSVLTLTAQPAPYFHFDHWSGAVGGISNRVQLTLSQPQSVTAWFAQNILTNGVPEWWLAQYHLPLSDAGALADTDGDGLKNWEEFVAGSDPTLTDTDGDGYSDAQEFVSHTNPADSNSIPRVTLVVAGLPDTHGVAVPAYGTNSVPFLTVVTSSVPLIVNEGPGVRFVNAGWTGTGDVPSNGASNTVVFMATRNSSLTWKWQPQFAFVQATNFGGSSYGVPANEAASLLPGNAQPQAGFGSRVAIDGNTVLVASPLRTNVFAAAGVASIYKRTNGIWLLEATLTPNDPSAYAYFGSAVALQGDVAVIGSYGNSSRSSCDAYVFRRAAGGWVLEAKLVTNITGDGWELTSVALDNGLLAIGAVGDSSRASMSGSVWLYRRNISQWAYETRLTPDDARPDQHFGAAVSVKGDRVLVGAPGDSSVNFSGAAYLFRRLGQSWGQQAKLINNNAAADAEFGRAVSLDSTRGLVGAPYDELNGVPVGAAYIYDISSNSVAFQAKLSPLDPEPFQLFGAATALRGDQLLIGAPYANANTANAGLAVLYRRLGSAWIPFARMNPSAGQAFSAFGNVVALSDTTAFVGAPDRDIGGTRNAGAAYLFDATPLFIEGSTAWMASGSVTQTIQAVSTINASNTVFQFTGWALDGVRQAHQDGQPVNPLTSITMAAPHLAVAGYLPANADVDNDGMPDWWETYYFGSVARGPDEDADGDGQKNRDEFMAGTNPNDPASSLRLSAIIAPAPANALVLRWPSIPGKRYSVRCTREMGSPFLVLATNILATPPLNTFAHPIGNDSRGFYYIQLEP